MIYGFFYGYPRLLTLGCTMSWYRETKMYVLVYIKSFPYNNNSLTKLRYPIVSHINFMQFHMISNSLKVIYYHLNNLTLPQTQNTFYIFCNEIFRLLIGNYITEE